MMHGIHGEPPYGPIQPSTISHLRHDVLMPAPKTRQLISVGYDECIGAKKHLVTGLLSHAGQPKASNSFAIGAIRL